MKAVVFDQHGGPEVLHHSEVPEPELTPNEVIVKVRAAACNFNDIWARRGLPGMKVILPHVSGSDVAGEVVAVGSEVGQGDRATGFNNLPIKVGDEVVVHCGLSCRVCEACTRGDEFFCKQFKIWGFQTGPLDGGHAEYIRIPAANLLPKPKNLSWEAAASIPLVLVTVWRMLVTRARIRPNDSVLIWGAAGGLGSMAVQIARLFNAHPIAVIGSSKKEEFVRCLGAEHVIDRSRESVPEAVKRITDRRGVDIVFEHTGAETWQDGVQSLRWGGTLVTCGATTGFIGQTDIRFLWNKQMNLLGSHLGNKGELIDAMKFVESGHIRPVVHRTLPLRDAAEAQRIMENAEVQGKLVLVP